MSFHDASDMISRIQSELAGAEPSIPLSAVEALGLLKGRLGATDNAELALECGIAASLARSASERISRMERRVSITSQTYLNRLAQYLNAFART